MAELAELGLTDIVRMKGFVSNLGINKMYHQLIPMVEKLRVQDMNLDDEMKRLEVLYEDTYKTIEGL